MSDPGIDILVVEDNKALLQILCEMLELLGHRPHGVATAELALDCLNARRFDVLLADIQLPGINGIDLATIAVGIVPGLRIVFSSGHGYLLCDALHFDFTVLHKPYFIDQLADAVGAPVSRAPLNKIIAD